MANKKWRIWLVPVLALVLVAALVAACASSAASGSAGNRSGSRNFLSTVAWDAEYDVVVAGFGFAGATASITAADAGAKVLLLEKAPEGLEGGNSRYAGQDILCPVAGHRDEAIQYYKGMRGEFDNQTDEMIEFMIDGAMANKDWLLKMGLDESTLVNRPWPEYPDLPGANDLSVMTIHINVTFRSDLYKFIHGLVDSRRDKIDVWYASPATRLIQDPNTKIIHGVELLHEGKTYRVRAKNGVVLAAGGFENNPIMLESFVQLADGYSKAARYNTGDGIKMAQAAGADLWHMSTMAGPDVNFINPNSGIAQAYAVGFMTPWTSQNSLIYVGGNGRRFMNEAAMTRHGHVEVAGTWFSLLVPQNAWAIFDESARLAGPAYPSWSRGMEEEIAKGWVIRAGTIQELAQKTGINAAELQDEITKFNTYCRAGNDPQYGNGVLKALAAQGPYYAFPLKATLTNTQGGPRRNINCEIVDPYDTPIPHLYSAGEMGSFYTDIYNGGGNISECLYTGRTAGANAARLKDDVSPANVLSSNKIDFRSDSLEEFLSKAQTSLSPNEYIGVGSGMGRELVLKVKVSGGDIQDISFIRIFETPEISSRAVIQIPKAIIDTDSTHVDTVTGATVTSLAIIQAVNDAISKAK